MDFEDFEDIFKHPTPAMRRKMSAVGLRGIVLDDRGDPYDEDAFFVIDVTKGKPPTKKEIEDGDDYLHSDGNISFYLQQLPGCCGVLVVYDLAFSFNLSTAMVDLVMREFWNEVYREDDWGNLIIATTIASQKQFAEYLERGKFRTTTTSVNPRTNNLVTMWETVLKPRRGKKPSTPTQPFRITPTYRAAGW